MARPPADTQRHDVILEHRPGDRFWTLSSTFVLTNYRGEDIYRSRAAIVFDRDTMERARDLLSEALATAPVI